MRLLTILAIAALAAGVYHYRTSARRPAARKASPNEQLARRVRAAIESSIANPGGVEVRVSRGTVTLRGRVRQEERDFVLAAALGAPGVTRVANYLEIDEPGGEVGTMQSGIATGV
ncbi:MAG: BON domain-containing protein [Burkholderiales bacterium]